MKKARERFGESKASQPFGVALPSLAGLGIAKPCFPCGFDLSVSPRWSISHGIIRYSHAFLRARKILLGFSALFVAFLLANLGRLLIQIGQTGSWTSACVLGYWPSAGIFGWGWLAYTNTSLVPMDMIGFLAGCITFSLVGVGLTQWVLRRTDEGGRAADILFAIVVISILTVTGVIFIHESLHAYYLPSFVNVCYLGYSTLIPNGGWIFTQVPMSSMLPTALDERLVLTVGLFFVFAALLSVTLLPKNSSS